MSPVVKSQPDARKAAEPDLARRTPAPAAHVTPSSPLPLQTLLYLQKFAGNAAVAEMLGVSEKREIPQREEPRSPAPGDGSPPAAANQASSAASVTGPAGAQAPGAMALVGEVAGVALPVVGAIAAPFTGMIGSLFGSAVAPAPPQADGQAAQPQAADQKAPSGKPQAGQQPGAEAGGTTGVASLPGPAIAAGPPQANGQLAAKPQAVGQQALAHTPNAQQQPATSGAAAPMATAVDGAAPATDAASGGESPTPATDPNFLAVKTRVHGHAAQSRQHPPAHAKVAEAQAAAHGPANEVASQAGAAQVETMSAQQPGGFDKKAFMAAVRQAIDASAPRTLEEADDFKGSGKAGQVQGQVSGLVGQNKQAAEQGIKGATEAAPDTSAARPKPVTAMPAEQPGSPPAPAGAASAMPSPKSPDEVSLAKGPAEVNASMQEGEVTEEQLKQSNEPEFTGALDAKQSAEKHSEEAPQAFRQQEQGVLQKAGGSAGASADQGLRAMHGDRAKALTAVATGKGHAKTQDEARRAEVSSKIDTIYGKTKTDATAILNGIDPQVDATFKEGEEKARAGFESYVDTRMTAYKDDRYSGLRGKWRWVKDKFAGLPSGVNQFYVQGRELYLSRMEGVISNVADVVGRELTRAKSRIAQGQSEIAQYVGSLPTDLKKVGQEAQQNIQGKFDELTQTVDAKQDDLVNDLAKKYVESRDAVDAHIKEMKDANKGLIDRAKDAVMGVINTIRNLKDMLLNVLAKAAGVIGTIITAPIKFLGNLVSGVKQGLTQFMSNIGEHLKKGLLGWLFGALGEAGLTLPEKFDLKGILSIIMQVLGLTYSHIRGLAVGIVGEEVVGHLEKSLEFFQVLIKEGPAGLWTWIVEKLSELKETVMTKIKEFIQEKVIIAGIMWLIGLLNPVAAFIKACKAIYDIVSFFIDRAQQVGELVNAIVDSVGAIAGGALVEAAGKVENALAKGIPVAIGFLASLLGLGGISDKIKTIIHAIQEPIHNVIGKVLGVVLKPFKWIGNKIKQGAGWAKKKLQQGVTYVKDKAKAGVAFVKGKAANLFAKKETPESKAVKEEAHRRLGQRTRRPFENYDGLHAAVAAVEEELRPQGLERLTLKPARSGPPGTYGIVAVASPPTIVGNGMVTGGGGGGGTGKSFKLAGGTFQEHEASGPIILKASTVGGKDKEKYIHLLSDHGPQVTNDALQAKLEATKQDFETERSRIIALHQQTIKNCEAKKVQNPKKAPGLDATINQAQAEIAKVTALDATDAQVVEKQLSKWSSKGYPAMSATRFASSELMEKALKEALADPAIQTRIDHDLTVDDGHGNRVPRPTGWTMPSPMDYPVKDNLGVGYQLSTEMKIVPITDPLNRVVIILVVSAEWEYKVYTAWPSK